MADQTEQEPMDPWDYLAEFIEANAVRPPGGQQAGSPMYPLVPSVAKQLRAIVAGGRAASAAHLRERDAQIARLSAQVEQAVMPRKCDVCGLTHLPGVYSGNGKVGWAECFYRAERNAAQQEVEGQAELTARANRKAEDLRQQTATLTEALTDVLPQARHDGRCISGTCRCGIAKASAALQSTRPQEQP